MQIIGNGMVARSLHPYCYYFPDVVMFAGGVANSALLNDDAYERELGLLQQQLELCARSGNRLVYFSSAGAIYGPTEELRDENTPTHPITRYGKHKLACETMIRTSDARYLIVRLANLVGSGQNESQLIPALTRQVKQGSVKLQSCATRDIMDVTDFADILNRLLPVVPDNELIVIASGISVPVSQLVDAIQDAIGVSAVIERLDSGESQRVSIAKLRSFLPDITFHPDYYRKVIQRYVWMKAYGTPPTQEST